MSNRPGNKKTVGAWVTPQLQAAIDQWRTKHPGISQSAFALTAYAEKLRKDGIKIEDAHVISDGRVRDPGISSPPTNLKTFADDQTTKGLKQIRNRKPAAGK